MEDIRIILDRLIREHGTDYVSLSKMLGRNAAYIQQFIKRGIPRKLDEDDRRALARFFGIAESVLGAPESPIFAPDPMTRVPRYALGASAGPGAVGADEAALGHFGFDPLWLKKLTANPGALSGIQVAGDSMEPTLTDGDEILVDSSDGPDRVRDGIYVLRVDDALIVKRLAINPVDRCFSIRSDNPTYPDWEGVDPAGVTVIGRVIWAGRKVR
jgi:phage repressor protein C with HTH and peptisase S24 domain